MVLVNPVAFVDFKMLHNLVSCRSLCLQITTDVNKITKNAQPDLTFIVMELSENFNRFT